MTRSKELLHNCFLLLYYAAGYVILFEMKIFIKKRLLNTYFTRKHDTKSIFMKVDTETKFQGLQHLQNISVMFVIEKLRNIGFYFG